MSVQIKGPDKFFVTGGTLPVAARSYVERSADTELYQALAAGEFCYVLDTRQMGKSSLMARAAQKLRADGWAVAVLDLTGFGASLTSDQWYSAQIRRLGKDLGLEKEFAEFEVAHRSLGGLDKWSTVIENLLKRTQQNVAIFIDEIDYVRLLPFPTDEFFAGIREFYNRRPFHPDFNRLTFCLLGVATPNSLIRDAAVTPFNIGKRIDLKDFTREECRVFEQGLDSDPDSARKRIDRVYYWTSGHPFLTQSICNALTNKPESNPDEICKDVYFAPGARDQDNNLRFVASRLLSPEVDTNAVLFLYQRILDGDKIEQRAADDTQADLLEHLKLSGIAKVADGRYTVRNEIYSRVFNLEWIEANREDQESRRLKLAAVSARRRTAVYAFLALLVLGALTIAWFTRRQSLLNANALQVQQHLNADLVKANDSAKAEGAKAEEQRKRAEAAALEAQRQADQARLQTTRAEKATEAAKDATALLTANQEDLRRALSDTQTAKDESDRLRGLSDKARLEAENDKQTALRATANAKFAQQQAEDARHQNAYNAVQTAARLLRETEPSKTELGAVLSILASSGETVDSYNLLRSFLDVLPPPQQASVKLPGTGGIAAVAFSQDRTKMAVLSGNDLGLVDWTTGRSGVVDQIAANRTVLQLAISDNGNIGRIEMDKTGLKHAYLGTRSVKEGERPEKWSPGACKLAYSVQRVKLVDYCSQETTLARGAPKGTPIAISAGGRVLVCGKDCILWLPRTGKTTKLSTICTAAEFLSEDQALCTHGATTRILNLDSKSEESTDVSQFSSASEGNDFAIENPVIGIQFDRPTRVPVDHGSKIPVIGTLLRRVTFQFQARPLAQFTSPPDFIGMALNHDGTVLAVLSKGLARFYLVPSKEELSRLSVTGGALVGLVPYRRPSSEVPAVGANFWLNGTRFAFVGSDRVINTFDVVPGDRAKRTLLNPSVLIADGPRRFRAVQLGQPVDSFNGVPGVAAVRAIGVNGSNSVVVTADSASQPQRPAAQGNAGKRAASVPPRLTVSVRVGDKVLTPVSINTGNVVQAAISADGSAAAVSLDQNVNWYTGAGDELQAVVLNATGTVSGLAFHREGLAVAVGARLMLFRSGAPEKACFTWEAPGAITGLEGSPDGLHILIRAGAARAILGPGFCEQSGIQPGSFGAGAVRFSPKGTFLVSDDLRLTPVNPGEPFVVPYGAVNWAIDPSESVLAAATVDDVALYSLTERKEIGRIPGRAIRLAFGTDGKFLAILPAPVLGRPAPELTIHAWRFADVVADLCGRIRRSKALTTQEADVYAKDVPNPTRQVCLATSTSAKK